MGKVPYAYYEDQWVGYEDEDSMAIKMDYIRDNGYGGGMIWAIDLDDYHGDCGRKHGLLRVMNEKLAGYKVTVPHESKLTTTAKPGPTWWRPWSSTTTTTAKPTTKRRRISTTTTTTTTTEKPSSTTEEPCEYEDEDEEAHKPSSSSPKPTPKTTSNTTEEPCEDDDEHERENELPSGSSSTAKPAVERPRISCTDGQRFFPDSSDCSKYFWCVHGKPMSADCPSGTMWDSDKQRCDWEKNVNRDDCEPHHI